MPFLPPPVNDRHAIDITEAPEGFYPITKASVIPEYGINICALCDWRKDCDGHICSCMSYKRKDGVSVVFKRMVSV